MADVKLVKNTAGALYVSNSSLSTDKCGYTASAGIDKNSTGSGLVSYGGASGSWYGGDTPTITCNDVYGHGYMVHLVAQPYCATFQGWYLNGAKVSSNADEWFYCKKCCHVGRYMARFKEDKTCSITISIPDGGGKVYSGGKVVGEGMTVDLYKSVVLTPWPDDGKRFSHWLVIYPNGNSRTFYPPSAYNLEFTCTTCQYYWFVFAYFTSGSGGGGGGYTPGGDDIDPFYPGASCSGGTKKRLLIDCDASISKSNPVYYYYKFCKNGKVTRDPPNPGDTKQITGKCCEPSCSFTINGHRYYEAAWSSSNNCLALIATGPGALVQSYVKVNGSWKWV